jgi:hypothetical protein
MSLDFIKEIVIDIKISFIFLSIIGHLYGVLFITRKLLPYPSLWTGELPVGIWPVLLLYVGSAYIIFRINKKFRFITLLKN